MAAHFLLGQPQTTKTRSKVVGDVQSKRRQHLSGRAVFEERHITLCAQRIPNYEIIVDYMYNYQQIDLCQSLAPNTMGATRRALGRKAKPSNQSIAVLICWLFLTTALVVVNKSAEQSIRNANIGEPQAVTLHTTLGDLKIEIFCESVPISAYNFLALCASGYYDGTEFHRNIKGFMIQGGDPTGTGKGGKSIYGDLYQDEFVDTLTHSTRGILSMANKGPNSNGSQFFITYAQADHLNKKYTIFGRIIGGWETLNKMEKAATDEKNRPLTPIKIERITIHANPLADQ